MWKVSEKMGSGRTKGQSEKETIDYCCMRDKEKKKGNKMNLVLIYNCNSRKHYSFEITNL